MKTFNEQFNKLTEAYIANQIKPYDDCACWIGNLLGGSEWSNCRTFTSNNIVLYNDGIGSDFFREGLNEIEENGYTIDEIIRMEYNFLKILMENCEPSSPWGEGDISCKRNETLPDYEDALFLAFSTTMDILREIHISKGENVYAYVVKKRELVTN